MKTKLFCTIAATAVFLFFSVPSLKAQVNFEDSIIVPLDAKLPKHLTDDEDSYPIHLSLQELFKNATAGRSSFVVFWGYKNVTSLPVLKNMAYLEMLRKELQNSVDVYYAYVGMPDDFEKAVSQLKEYAQKNNPATTYEKAPFYITKLNEQTTFTDIGNVFAIDPWVLKSYYPLPVLVDGTSKRTRVTDINAETISADLGLLLYETIPDRKAWTAAGKYEPIISTTVVSSLLQKNFLDAEDFLKAKGYYYGGFYNEKSAIFKKDGGIFYIRFDCACPDKQLPDIIVGIKANLEVQYAAFTSKPEVMNAVAEELQNAGYTKGYPGSKDAGTQYYWTHPTNEYRFFADGVQFAGKYEFPLLVEAALKELTHRWDKLKK